MTSYVRVLGVKVHLQLPEPSCLWCLKPVLPNTPCSCDRAQEEARRIRADRR